MLMILCLFAAIEIKKNLNIEHLKSAMCFVHFKFVSWFCFFFRNFGNSIKTPSALASNTLKLYNLIMHRRVCKDGDLESIKA